jgi:CheY-like chemotaxis protein
MTGGLRRILVIEDDPETAAQLVASLASRGYQVDHAISGNDGLRRGRSADYSVMTIDRMLPDIDGISIIRQLREAGILTPALIISALGEVDDRVRGLRAGGDDYLVNPLPLPNYWPALRRWPAVALPSSRKLYCVSAISNSIWCRERRGGATGKSDSWHANFKFSNI